MTNKKLTRCRLRHILSPVRPHHDLIVWGLADSTLSQRNQIRSHRVQSVQIDFVNEQAPARFDYAIKLCVIK